MHHHRTAGLLLALSAIAGSAHAEDHAHRQHQAHEHGAGTLNIALEGNTLMIELTSPAMNIVGFEHAPRTDAQRQSVERAVATLQRGETLFLTPQAAACRLREATVASGLLEEPRHDGRGEAHSDFEAAYRFECGKPMSLNHLRVELFAAFPATEALAVQLLGEHGQRAAELTAANPQLKF